MTAPRFLGNSETAYTKLALTHRQYLTLKKNTLTFAYRLGWQGTIDGKAPFYMQPYMINTYTKSTKNDGLGGARSLRGILRNRVVGDAFTYGNFELRYKFLKFHKWKQNFYFSLNGFSDMGMITKTMDMNLAGIPFDEERMTKPFIHEAFLPEIFGEYTPEVTAEYLEVSGWQRFNLKKEYDTQRKIQHFFGGKADVKNLKIRDGLYALCNEVLFVRDRMNHNLFHPRITAQHSYSYRYLDDNVKSAFNRLYDDFYYRRHNYFFNPYVGLRRRLGDGAR
jgi:hypothetical protein